MMRTFTAAELQHCADTIAADGVAIIPDAIDRALLIEVRAELSRLKELRLGGDIPPAPLTGFVTRRWLDVLNDGEVWQRVAIHPAILGVMPKVLGDGFLLSTMATAVIGPGEHTQPLHVDDSVYLFPRPHPNLVWNTMWAISDFTALNGCTRFVSGSNKWSHDPVPGEVYEYDMLEMPPAASHSSSARGTTPAGTIAAIRIGSVSRSTIAANRCDYRRTSCSGYIPNG